VAVARYGAIGSGASQTQVVLWPWVRRPTRRPLEIASSPAGTVTTKVKDALSVGWSLRGNQLAEPSGSLTTTAPSSVWIQP